MQEVHVTKKFCTKFKIHNANVWLILFVLHVLSTNEDIFPNINLEQQSDCPLCIMWPAHFDQGRTDNK